MPTRPDPRPRPALLALVILFLAASVAWQRATAQQPAPAPPPVEQQSSAGPASPPADTEGAASSGGGGRRRSRRGAEFATAELVLDADRKIELRFDQPTMADAAYAAILSPVDGQVVPFVKSRPLKLKTPVDLRFGDTLVEAENHVPGYPGVYSLWLKSTGGEWRLVFNDLADVWGTQHDPSADAAEVPLEASAAAEPVESFTAALEEAEGGGILRLAWGATAWSARFTIE